MSLDQALVFIVLAGTVLMFLWGQWRHDMVALAALLACVVLGLVPAEQAFLGFGHPAVITVAAVLVLSQGLQSSGLVDLMVDRMIPSRGGRLLGMASLMVLGAFLSAFMNNVGAMALLMPVALTLAARYEVRPGQLLMPLAFATILGGMATLIGTPPNLIVSGFRAELTGDSFAMFDFAPVGATVALTGILFIVLVGWRLVPRREASQGSSFDTGKYLTEARVTEISKVNGQTIAEAEALLDDEDGQIVALVRGEFELAAPNPHRTLRRGDIVVIEADPEALSGVLSTLGLRLEEEVELEAEDETSATASEASAEQEDAGADVVPESDTDEPDEDDTDSSGESRDRESRELLLRELVVMPTSPLRHRSASDIQLRTVYGLNLLAISREGRERIRRLRSTMLQPGDVLLMQGSPEALQEFTDTFRCVPLAERQVRLPDKRAATLAGGIMAAAVTGAAFGLLPAAVSFVAGVLAYMVLRVTPPRRIYDAIDWPVVVLLGALIPVAGAMSQTGAADYLAGMLLASVGEGSPVLALAIMLVVTMTLSDFVNNAATAAVMCPIAVSTSAQLGVNADAFLMAVAVGASCAFLTPIGHQNNTLILGPGGFRFSDYWRLGLPMELLVVALSMPLLLWAWPLY